MKTPSLPDRKTLSARALMRLLSGQKITHRGFQNETASYRLSSFIENLRNRHGWIITTQDETAPTADPVGRTAVYGVYLIEPEILATYRQAFGVRLDQFIEAVRRFEAATPTQKTGKVLRRAANEHK